MQLPYFLKTPAVAIIGNTCYTILVEELDYHNVQCIKLGISKGLGYGIVFGGAIVKMPQIFKILKTHSTLGLSLTSFLLETLACVINLAYNLRHENSFSTYGETFFVLFQNLVILALILHYTGKKNSLTVITLSSFLILGIIFMKNIQQEQQDGSILTVSIISEDILTLFQKAVIPINVLSKIPQIRENYNNKSTGQLSAFTIFNYFVGSLARIYTTLTEVKDPIILYGFLLSTLFNCLLAFQMALYWNSSRRVEQSLKSGESITSVSSGKKKKLD
ncbi:hypothetical protein BGZ46_003195 [Entomortierella lignicola]|nr:hypothetical protein BGZ46_003195 [Entomortierella lignicola]